MSTQGEAWKKRHAIQIAAQLPEDPDDALSVLGYARDLVEDFLREGGSDGTGVISFMATRKRSASAKLKP